MTTLPRDFPPIDVPPGPRLAEPLPSGRRVQWGILATGKIAHAFAENLTLLPEAQIAAVGARRLESAQTFADEYAVDSAYGSYQQLVEDPNVDIVYVATPHALHKEHVLMAFAAGKPVLCEKALTLNVRDTEDLVTAARQAGLFFMEGMWMRCNPLMRRLQQLFATGALGSIQQVRADLGFVVDKPSTDRLLDPALGGGALLDMGVYPLTFAQLFLGAPSTIAAAATVSAEGVDLNLALALGYDSGAIASLSTSMTAWSPRTASIATELGRIDIPAPFHHPTRATWTAQNADPDLGGPALVEEISEELIGTGLGNEALEVMRCLRNGETESPLVPLDETIAMTRLTDQIREQIGVRYGSD